MRDCGQASEAAYFSETESSSFARQSLSARRFNSLPRHARGKRLAPPKVAAGEPNLKPWLTSRPAKTGQGHTPLNRIPPECILYSAHCAAPKWCNCLHAEIWTEGRSCVLGHPRAVFSRPSARQVGKRAKTGTTRTLPGASAGLLRATLAPPWARDSKGSVQHAVVRFSFTHPANHTTDRRQSENSPPACPLFAVGWFGKLYPSAQRREPSPPKIVMGRIRSRTSGQVG